MPFRNKPSALQFRGTGGAGGAQLQDCSSGAAFPARYSAPPTEEAAGQAGRTKRSSAPSPRSTVLGAGQAEALGDARCPASPGRPAWLEVSADELGAELHRRALVAAKANGIEHAPELDDLTARCINRLGGWVRFVVDACSARPASCERFVSVLRELIPYKQTGLYERDALPVLSGRCSSMRARRFRLATDAAAFPGRAAR